MPINSKQVRELIVRPALEHIGKWSESAEELLMGTAAQESHMGTYIKQLGGGPALGIFQMEPATHGDIWDNYLYYKPKDFKSLIKDLLPVWAVYSSEPYAWSDSMVHSLQYAAAMCRVHYLRKSEPLPYAWDLEGQARYWKEHYNTHLGKGTEEEFLHNYKRFVTDTPYGEYFKD